MTARTSRNLKSQLGLTLIEMIAALAIFALVIGGALALFNSGSSSQASTQMTSDLSALRAAVKQLYFGKGGYGTTSINGILVNGMKVPTTMTITAGAPPTITHGLGGTVSVMGDSTRFTVEVTGIPTEVCLSILSSSTGWSSVKVGTAAALTTFPIMPETASTQCSAAATNSVLFQSS